MPYLDRFPLEGYPFFSERQWGLCCVGDVLLCVAFFLVAVSLLSLVWGATKRNWQSLSFLPKTRFRRQVFLVSTYVCFAASCGSFYHALFQLDPDHFRINPTSGDVRLVDAIMGHRQALENLRDAQQIIADTVAGLRSEPGREALSDFAHALPDGEVRTTYAACLLLAVVGPPQPLTSKQAKYIERLEGIPGLAEKLQMAEKTVGETSPEFLMPIPYWPRLRALQRYQLYNMRWLVQKWLERVLPGSGLSIKDYATEEDSQRLAHYLTDSLHIELSREAKVDLRAASTPIEIIQMHEETALKLGTQKLDRLVDLMYFSFMTISTVGYGDILPNSTLTRAIVILEVMLGILVLVFFVNEFLQQ